MLIQLVAIMTVLSIPGSVGLSGRLDVRHDNEVFLSTKPVSIDPKAFPSLRRQFGFQKIQPADLLLGSLTPKSPMAYGLSHLRNSSNSGLYTIGCSFPRKVSLIVEAHDGYKIIQTEDSLRRYFAPIHTREEALSFVAVATGYKPQYQFPDRDEIKAFMGFVNTSYAKAIDNGYEVGLFDYHACGCGPHGVFLHRYFVNHSGYMVELSVRKIYQKIADENSCMG